jgi:hypothetical protein
VLDNDVSFGDASLFSSFGENIGGQSFLSIASSLNSSLAFNNTKPENQFDNFGLNLDFPESAKVNFDVGSLSLPAGVGSNSPISNIGISDISYFNSSSSGFNGLTSSASEPLQFMLPSNADQSPKTLFENGKELLASGLTGSEPALFNSNGFDPSTVFGFTKDAISTDPSSTMIANGTSDMPGDTGVPLIDFVLGIGGAIKAIEGMFSRSSTTTDEQKPDPIQCDMKITYFTQLGDRKADTGLIGVTTSMGTLLEGTPQLPGTREGVVKVEGSSRLPIPDITNRYHSKDSINNNSGMIFHTDMQTRMVDPSGLLRILENQKRLIPIGEGTCTTNLGREIPAKVTGLNRILVNGIEQ